MQDLRDAYRSLRSTPVVSAVAILSLALGIGSTLLYGPPPRDPVTLAAAAAVLVSIGAIAGWIPARRASRVDPARVLRDG